MFVEFGPKFYSSYLRRYYEAIDGYSFTCALGLVIHTCSSHTHKATETKKNYLKLAK